MKVLVYPHAMELGGSQLNAIELAGAVRDLGHQVAVIGEDGPLAEKVSALGLERVPITADRRRPSPGVAKLLRRMIRQYGIDVVHGYEWPPALDAAAAVFPNERAVAVCTIMSMAVAPFLPVTMPLVVGTEALRRHTATRRSGPVYLIEPPVDVVENAPGQPVADFRARYLGDSPGSPKRTIDIGVVCRLVPELKLEGVLVAIDVVGALAARWPVRLVITGDGTARDEVERRASAVNARAGRQVVLLTGELFDPRPAYDAADIMLGMGGSALRALAFGKPLVVQGERGFWSLLTPQSVEVFLLQGWYGIGDGRGAADRLYGILEPLLADAARREELGRYGRDLAVQRFSLQRAARLQEDIYRKAIAARHESGAVRQATVGARSAVSLAAHKVRRRVERLRGTEKRDDFNAVTLAADAMSEEDEAR